MTGTVPELLGGGDSQAIGTFFKSGSPAIVEALGNTPLDFLLVDTQHAAPSLETVESIVRAADLVELPVLVRLPEPNPGLVTNLLDAGVKGIVVPQVDDSETARRIVETTRFDGTRSYATSTRAGGYGARDRDEYVAWVRESIAVIPMIETETGVERAEEIASVDGVTALMTGPADLSIDLGTPHGSERHQRYVQQIFDAANVCEIPVGEYVGDSAALQEDSNRSFAVYGSDIGLLTEYFSSTL